MMETNDGSLVWRGLAAGSRVVDLSATISPSPAGTPIWQSTGIDYMDHRGGARDMEEKFGVPARLLRDEEGPAAEAFTHFGTHNSTHVDSPYHYNSTIEGRRARSIEQLPLDWFVGPGVVLGMSGRRDGDVIEIDDLVGELERIGHALVPGDIVLIHTGSDRFYGEPDYPERGPGVSAEATRWLYDRGVRVMGIDAWGWDRPPDQMAREAVEADRPGIFWAAHQIDREYAQIERLVNLGSLPPTGALVICLPLKIEGGSAGPTRAVALIPDDGGNGSDREGI